MSDACPSESSAADQPQAHSGRQLLRDNPQLQDVLRKQDEYMLHLVNASRTPADSPDPPLASDSSVYCCTGSDAAGSASPVVVGQESQEGGLDGPRYRCGFPRCKPAHPAAAPAGGDAPWPHGGAQGDAYAPMQMLWWQQMYAWHYYIQNQVAMAASQPPGGAAGAPLSPSLAPSGPNPAAPEPPTPLQNLPDDQDVVRATATAQHQQQGRAEVAEDEEPLGADWLERLYTVSNVCVLLSIMYFSSSVSLLVIVAGAMLLVYLHQNAWLPFRPEQQLQNPPGGGGDGAPAREEEAEEVETGGGEGGGGPGDSGGGASNARQQPPPGGVATGAWTFVSTFFTSLIPEGHPAN